MQLKKNKQNVQIFGNITQSALKLCFDRFAISW